MKRIIFLFFGVLFFNSTKSQVVINEVCWTNGVNLHGLTPVTANNSPDYIELYNATPSFTHSLAGYYLTNSKTDLYKWEIPNNLSLGPGQYITFWCSGRNTKEPGALGRWHTNFTIEQCQNQWVMLTFGGVIKDSIYVRRTKSGDSWGKYPDGNTTGSVRWYLFQNGSGLGFDN